MESSRIEHIGEIFEAFLEVSQILAKEKLNLQKQSDLQKMIEFTNRKYSVRALRSIEIRLKEEKERLQISESNPKNNPNIEIQNPSTF